MKKLDLDYEVTKNKLRVILMILYPKYVTPCLKSCYDPRVRYKKKLRYFNFIFPINFHYGYILEYILFIWF